MRQCSLGCRVDLTTTPLLVCYSACSNYEAFVNLYSPVSLLNQLLICCLFVGVGVALKQALTPEFKTYQQQVVSNAQTLSKGLQKHGYTIVSGKYFK